MLRQLSVFITNLALVVACGMAGTAIGEEYSWQNQRVRLRSVRNELRDMATHDAKHRAQANALVVANLIDLAERDRVRGQTARLQCLVAQIAKLDADSAKHLRRRIDALGAESQALPEHSTEWQEALISAESELVKRPGELLNRAVELGLFDLAHQFIQEIFAFSPGHAGLRASLGHSWHENDWKSTFTLDRSRQGLCWSDRWGWILQAEQARYEAGEYFDLERGEWSSLEDANALHATIENPWSIRTEHLLLTGNLELQEMVQIATGLEDFYEQVFAAYAAFFARAPQDYKLVLGLASHAPLMLKIFRDTEEFGLAYPRRPKWSKGIFDPTSQTCFLVGSAERVMYHEFTHQILHVFAKGNRSPAWLTEGIAVYTQSPNYIDGELLLGKAESNPTLQKHFSAFRQNEHMRLDELLAIETLGRWGAAENPEPQYAAAGSLVQFCMEAKDRSFRADFIDFLSDSYRGKTQDHKLWEYLGLDKETFVEFYQEWLREMAGQSINAVQKPTKISASPLHLMLAATALGADEKPQSSEETRLAVPLPADQQEALDVIRKEVFANDYKRATSRTGKLSLADKLFREGIETLDDNVARYVLMQEATQLACEGGDVDRSFRFINEIARLYQVKPLELKTEALSTASKTAEANPAVLAIANHALNLVTAAAAEDDYELAKKVGTIGLAASERIDNRGLQQQLTTKLREVDRVRTEYSSVRASIDVLKTKPDDPTANTAVGKYHCFIKGDWATGLPMLAKGSDAALKELAEIELAASQEPAAQVKLGDAWWKVGRDAVEPTKTHALARAAHWYRAVSPRLSGLTKSKVQERLRQLERGSK